MSEYLFKIKQKSDSDKVQIQNNKNKNKMSFSSHFRAFWKTPIFIFFVLSFLGTSLLWRVLFYDLKIRRKFYVKTVSFFCRLCLKVGNVYIQAKNIPNSKDKDNNKDKSDDKDKNYLYVSNHLGIYDIFILAAYQPTLFVTSMEMKGTFGLGFLTEMGGCLYVERRDRANIKKEWLEIQEVLKQGFSVTLYPEAMAGDGQALLPFKKTLLTSPAGTGVPIMPLILNFTKVNGELMSDRWRDFVFWYGDISFYTAFWRILSLKRLDVEMSFFQEIYVQSEDQRREIAAHIHELLEKAFIPILRPGHIEIRDELSKEKAS